MTHLSTHQLTERVNNLAAAAKDNGTVTSLVIRPDADEREVVDHIRVVPGEGIVGDNYLVRGNPRTADGKAHPEAQICVMNADVLNVIADGDRSLMVVTAGEVSVGDTITKLDETGNGSFPPLAGR